MQNLEDYLNSLKIDSNLSKIILSLGKVVESISRLIKTVDTGKVGTINVYGEEQLALDVASNNIVIDELKKNSLIGLIASEELPAEDRIGKGEYGVCFDPLDGSSLVDVNFAVGSIFGIYKTKSFIGVKGDDQLASLIAVYGPRTTILITVKKGVQEFMLDGDEFVLTKENIKVGDGKVFAPGNLRACFDRKDYLNLLNYWCKEKYTLRYSGGMVPDINHILIKGKGIFTYPGYSEAPNGKLRLLFECAPMSLLMEQAGGVSTDGKIRILDKILENLEQRTPILIGSKSEVAIAQKFL